MQFTRSHLARFVLLLLIAGASATARAQSAPDDFQITATAGSTLPQGEAVSISIESDGTGSARRFRVGDLAAADNDPLAFSLTVEGLGQIWQAVQSNNFFGLSGSGEDSTVSDGSFAAISVTANASSHAVAVRSVAAPEVEAILEAINALAPTGFALQYETVDRFELVTVEVCEQSGAQLGKQYPFQISKVDLLSGAMEVPPQMAARKSSSSAADVTAHAGTVVAYVMSLQEAARRRVASLEAKGDFFGDAVSITVDNSGSLESDRIELKLYLEIWGFGASDEIAAEIESAIESAWSGTTSTGKDITVDVVTRVSTGTTSPGTPGFHQIQMVTDSTAKSEVFEKQDGFDVNNGVAGGIWRSVGKDRAELYAHEAGHLLRFKDRYDEFNRESDDLWRRESDNEPFTNAELADEIAPNHPELTKAEVLAKLSDPERTRATNPRPGHENDLMANFDGEVTQDDLDALAALAGLLVEVRPGDIFVNKVGSKQNFTVIRSEDVFVKPGESKTLNGIYTSCIDRSRGTPIPGNKFDVAPGLSEWAGIEARDYLLQLVEYLDRNDKFCPSDLFAQSVVWRLTNNASTTDTNVAAFLQDVGIDIGYSDLDFPRLSNTNFADTTSGTLTPKELYVPHLAAQAGDVQTVGETVSLTASLTAPSLNGVSSEFLWSLDAPDGSGASLSAAQGGSTTFTPDVRGFYEVTLKADVTDSTASTFRRETTQTFAAVDALVETFESGVIGPDAPYFWKSFGSSPWTITGDFHNSGAFAAASGIVGDNGTSTLQARFEQASDGVLSFSYQLFAHYSDSLLFTLDGSVLERWNGNDDWTVVSVDVPPGTHTAEWTYKKDGALSIGADQAFLDDVFFPESAVFTAIEAEGLGSELAYRLLPAFPNPVGGLTTIGYELPKREAATVVVFDGLGREVAVLASGLTEAGRYQLRFDTRKLASGVYYYRLRAGSFVQRRSMVVVH